MAQTPADAAKEINRIKLSKDYLYAETTMRDEAEALSGAQAILEMTISDWMASQKKGSNADAFIIQAKQHFTPIKTKRGEYHRAFVYVKKNDIIPVGVGSGTMVIENRNSQAVADEVTDNANEGTEVSSVEVLKAAVTLTSQEKELAAIRLFSEVEGKVKALQDADLLESYGKYKTLPQAGRCYLLVYDRQGNIAANLRREADGTLLNLNTMQDDNIENYKGCGAIWLQLKAGNKE
ncbi:MAG: hypothetical protein IJ767_01730 [Bacteroidaceae bacterium]|nr:hypothetical protein [Bacteroidaceae bacterium]MBR1800204.1 hypothetical protein [Bacteroidaceae bacterium]